MKKSKIFTIIGLIIAIFTLIIGAYINYLQSANEGLEGSDNENAPTAYIFHSNSCSHCTDAKFFLKDMREKGKINVKAYEVSDSDNVKIKEEVIAFLEIPSEKKYSVPLIIIGDEYFIGFGPSTKEKIENTIEKCTPLGSCPNETGKLLKGLE